MFINRYRFVELKYRRSEQSRKEGSESGGGKAARIETVVIFLPDIHSCMPNRSEWDGVQQLYKQALEKFLSAENNSSGSNKSGSSSDDVEIVTNTAEKATPIAESTTDGDQIETKSEPTEDVAMTTDVLEEAANDISIVNLASHKHAIDCKK